MIIVLVEQDKCCDVFAMLLLYCARRLDSHVHVHLCMISRCPILEINSLSCAFPLE